MVKTHGRASPPPNSGIAYRPPKSISSFVAGFKSSATKKVNQYRQTPGMNLWQERFHDHIIRNDAEYQRILEYIETNPAQWEADSLHNL
jgi:putative transposase